MRYSQSRPSRADLRQTAVGCPWRRPRHRGYRPGAKVMATSARPPAVSSIHHTTDGVRLLVGSGRTEAERSPSPRGSQCPRAEAHSIEGWCSATVSSSSTVRVMSGGPDHRMRPYPMRWCRRHRRGQAIHFPGVDLEVRGPRARDPVPSSTTRSPASTTPPASARSLSGPAHELSMAATLSSAQFVC